MRMKKLFNFLLFFSILMIAAMGIACSHTHVYDKQIVGNEYLKTEATCRSNAVYYYSCDCGEKSVEKTFEHGKFKNCIFVDDVCVNCGQKISTDGLEYKILEDGTYGVSIGTATEVEEIIVPYAYDGIKVTEVNKNGFKNCANLTSVELPESITSIGAAAFEGCANLTNINIPNGVTIINALTFNNCNNLSEIKIPDGVTTIDMGAFYNCGLTSLTLPGSLTTIGNSAFRACPISSVIIPISVTTIKSHAFANINNLSIFCRASAKPVDWIYNWCYEGFSTAPGFRIQWNYNG